LPAINPNEARITIALQNIPLIEALKYITELANLKFKVEPYAVSIVPQGTPTEVLLTKEYKVPPGFIGTVAGTAGTDALAPATPADATKGGSAIAGRRDAKEFLIAQGVQFPPGASATFIAATSRLIVRNTQENLDLIDTLVASGGVTGPVQVEIESKFVEISQNNLKELSFDWLVGAANVPHSGSLFASGGTGGTSPGVNPADFPFVAPGGTPVGELPLTAGNRSGALAINQNAIDALLFGTRGGSLLAPAVGALAGVFTDPQFQVVIRALNQKKGIDLLSAPRVTAKSGQRAVIEIIREFIYPTEFDPPQIPQNFGTGGSFFGGANPNLFGNSSTGSFPVTPTTPTAFTTRNTGVTLEVEPVIGPDGYTIDLNLVPQVVEFEGFINYGSPIQSTQTNALGQQIVSVITPNVINQPIFSTRKVTTSVSVFDGSTVVLGGLMREDVQKVEDKVPLLGDIPLIGRLFRSSVDQHLKRNLVIFVSARLINAAGEPVHLEEEEEEVVESLATPEVNELPLMPK
jgi:general secretion pathway protein D